MGNSPEIWILSAGRQGDYRQMQIIADRLGWPIQTKHLAFRKASNVLQVLAPRHYLTSADPFDNGCPGLVLCAEDAACALAAAARRSGKKFCLVCIGRPRGRFDEFDLILTSPQYPVPSRPNVVILPSPVFTDFERLPSLPTSPPQTPVTGVLVGGPSTPEFMDAVFARRFVEEVQEHARLRQSGLIVTTSPRTPPLIVDILAQRFNGTSEFVPWRKKQESILPTILKSATELIVTSDSVSMVVDCLSTGKPTLVYDLPRKKSLADVCVNMLSRQSWASSLFTYGVLKPRQTRQRLFDMLAKNHPLRKFSVGVNAPTGELLVSPLELAVSTVRETFLSWQSRGAKPSLDKS